MYKNWPAICALGKQNMRVMMALATIPAGDPLEARLAQAFPECFSETVVSGPVPMSVLREYARISAGKEGDPTGHDHVVFSHATRHYGVPVMEFTLTAEDNDSITGLETPPIPESDWKYFRIGDLFEWEGARYVVADKDDDFLCIVFAESIDMGA